MADAARISIAHQFSATPFGRYYEDGDESGQAFREKLLLPALKSGQHVVVDIDGVAGLPSSFWEEALGGAVRSGMTLADLRNLLSIETTEPDLETYVRIGWRYVEEAERKAVAARSH